MNRLADNISFVHSFFLNKIFALSEANLYKHLRSILCVLLILALNGCGFFGGSKTTTPPYTGPSKVVKTAYSQLGNKYRLGGASPQKGFDCSGLVWWSYKQNGVNIPRITRDQAKTGKSVSPKQAKAGDILVFRMNRRSLHTGLYAGQDSFIHSPRTGKTVCVEKLSATPWNSKLISVRRIR